MASHDLLDPLCRLWTFDMFTSLVELKWAYLVPLICSLYTVSFVFFATIWYVLARRPDACLLGRAPRSQSDNM